MFISIFFFNDTATTEIYTLSLHDALPIFGGADLLRRAMGKKKPEVMAEQREHFVRGAVHNGYPEEPAAKIFDLIAYFAGYGFNRSHSVAYALITYRTAYLKAHFPREFMAALITSDMDNTDKVMRYIGDCADLA